ncbi:MAG: galactokinase [Actinomycetota bacterium]|nr:galactokinase [Actinomycetota bacterium]
MSARAFRAPGRVNLMGDHTDYNEGWVLPLAIELECVAIAEARDDGAIHARSQELPGREAVLPADGGDPTRVSPSWGRYVAGVAAALGERGRPPVGATIVFRSTVPPGSGLSSSAALEVSCGLALCAVADFTLPPRELALACQHAEQLATGVPSGIMDQLASIAGRQGAALLIDCRNLCVEYVRVPDDIAILVVHSGVERTLEGIAYAERRAHCEALARELGVAALRDATWEQVRHDPLGRHVVSENARVHETARALAVGDAHALGRLFAESHASLRDDYRVSTRELDVLVDALVAGGAIGARLTGAGFGGAVVALSDVDGVHGVADTAGRRYRDLTGRTPTAWVTRPTVGAGRVREDGEGALPEA